MVLFAPEDMLLIVGSPSGRRGQIDTLVAQTVPAAGATMATYARALTQRNNLLRAVRDGFAAPDELRFWDGVIVEEGSKIVDWRRGALAALSAPLADAHAEIAPDEPPLGADVPVQGDARAGRDDERCDPPPAGRDGREGTMERPDARWPAPRRRLVRGRADATSRASPRAASNARPSWPSSSPRSTSYGSAHGRPPLLLLDDVFSELDPQRRAHLVRRIGELPQAFVTTTTADDLDPALVAASTVWEVAVGRLSRG